MMRLTSRSCLCIIAACLLVGCIYSDLPTPPASPPPPAQQQPEALSIRKAEPDAEVYKGILKGLGIEPVTLRLSGNGGPLTYYYRVVMEETVGSNREEDQKAAGSFGQVKGEATISFVLMPPSTGNMGTQIIVQINSQGRIDTMKSGLSSPLWFDWKNRSLGVESPVGDQPVTIEKGKEITLLRYEAREMVPTQEKEAPKQEPRTIRLTFSVRVGEDVGSPKK
jgi:hypothetical protein